MWVLKIANISSSYDRSGKLTRILSKEHNEIAWKLSQVEYKGRPRVKDIKTGVVRGPRIWGPHEVRERVASSSMHNQLFGEMVFTSFPLDTKTHCESRASLRLRVMEMELEILWEINEWERFIDEACVELNVEVKTAENEVQERKLREEKACVREEEWEGQEPRESCGSESQQGDLQGLCDCRKPPHRHRPHPWPLTP